MNVRRTLSMSGGILLGAALLIACDDPLGLEDRLEISFTLEPPQVEAGGTFEAHLRITNISRKPVELQGGCLSLAGVVVEGAPPGDPVRGTGDGCFDQGSVFPIEVGETLSRDWEMVAMTSSGALLSPGSYDLVLVWQVHGLTEQRVIFQVVTGEAEV